MSDLTPQLRKAYIHAGYILDWTDEKVQKEISILLAPHLTWEQKKKGRRVQMKIRLRKQPIVCMSYYRDGDPKGWYETHNQKGTIGYFKALWYKHESNVAVLQGTIYGKPVYVVICVDCDVPPIRIKENIASGKYTKVDIDMKCPVAAYAFVETRKLDGHCYYSVLNKEYLCGIPYSG